MLTYNIFKNLEDILMPKLTFLWRKSKVLLTSQKSYENFEFLIKVNVLGQSKAIENFIMQRKEKKKFIRMF